MRRRLANTRVTLQSGDLPGSPESTELNYRTNVTTPRQDAATTVRLASIVTLAFIVIGFGLRLLTVLPLYVSVPLIAGVAAILLGIAYAKFLQRRPATSDLLMAVAVLGTCVLFGLVNYAPTTTRAYLLIFGVAIAGAALLSHFITLQACFFMAVNERLRLRTVRRYQRYWWFVPTLKTPRRCPEIAAYRLSVFLLIVAFGIGYGVLLLAERTELSSYAAMFGVIGFLTALPTLWILADELAVMPATPMLDSLKAAWRALTTFVSYNRHRVRAAGLFVFPTKELRDPLKRDVALGVSLALLTTALVGVSVSSPWVLIERYWKSPPATAAAKTPELRLSPAEELFARELPPERRAHYIEAKRNEHQARESASWWGGVRRAAVNFFVATAAVLLLCWLGPLAVFVAVLWFTGGRLLTRYYEALEHSHAYELPPEPTPKELAAGTRSVTPWDNRVERIIWSNDPLETEHFYLGASLEGDYPVLLHEKLLQTHAHILGDTGSGKTSLGIAPLITQLIARENASVLIIDLKGDKSLFEAAREEAGVAGVPFKWFTNVTDRSSFVFNPLRQSHVRSMTTNQLTQGILQALALEYGEDYGRGYFSALNELVLATYMKHHRRHIGSFAELHGYVSDQNAYRAIGSAEDWEKTRHLASIVDRLAQVVPLNVTGDAAGGGPDDNDPPPHIREQIDMPTLLRERQVVYFYLSSAQEQTTVPKIAKLAMFSLLTAASRRGKGETNRVYVFVDEFQRVISENLRIFLEQARSMRLHFMLANQTIGQLEQGGADLTDLVESCTAFKQSFRATDDKSIKRLVETSGEAVYHSLQWTQFLNDSFADDDDDHLSLANARRQSPDGLVQAKVAETVGPRLEKNTIIEVSALPLASFVRFSESSGYTQFAGYPTPIISEYHITKALYGHREETAWPDQDERTVLVTPDDAPPPVAKRFIDKKVPIPKPTDVPAGFDNDLEKRLEQAGEKLSALPPKRDPKR
jgi:hypothetical protein